MTTEYQKYQIHCPECGHEFVWSHDELDWLIVSTGKRLKEVFGMIAAMEANNPALRLSSSDEYKRLRGLSEELKVKVQEMKAIKYNNNGITGEIFNQEFKEAVRDRLGDKAYYELIEETKERLKPRRTENMMREVPKK